MAGAADDRTFVLDMQKKNPNPGGSYPGASTFVVYQADRVGGAPLRRSAITLPGLTGTTHIIGIALSPDGNELAVLCVPADNTKVIALRLYSMSARQVVPVRVSATGTCANVLFTPDGKSMVCGSMTGSYFSGQPCAKDQAELAEYSLATGDLTRVLYRHKGACLTPSSSRRLHPGALRPLVGPDPLAQVNVVVVF